MALRRAVTREVVAGMQAAAHRRLAMLLTLVLLLAPALGFILLHLDVPVSRNCLSQFDQHLALRWRVIVRWPRELSANAP